jgi:hypothetical protein
VSLFSDSGNAHISQGLFVYCSTCDRAVNRDVGEDIPEDDANATGSFGDDEGNMVSQFGVMMTLPSMKTAPLPPPSPMMPIPVR